MGRRRFLCLHVAPDAGEPLPAQAVSLVALVRATERGSGGTMSGIVRQLRRTYGAGFVRFVQQYVLPNLVECGLAEPRQKRLLGLIPITRYYRTAAGEAECRRLEDAMRNARAIPDYLDHDPAQAAALFAAAGSAVLLIEELRPHYRKMAQAMRGLVSDIPVDIGNFDFSSCDFGSFDSFASCFDVFDACFDAAVSSDSGGDGGSSYGC